MGEPARMRAGTIRSVMPQRREVRVRPVPGFEAEFEAPAWLEVLVGGTPLRCKVDGASWHAGDAIIRLAPGVTRERVAEMRGAAVEIARAARRPRKDGLPHADEWAGVRAETADAALGVVADVIESPAHLVLVLQNTEGARFLLPAIPETIESFDSETRTLRVKNAGDFLLAEDEDAD